MNALVSFMASFAGRFVRVLAGAGLIAWGLLSVGAPNGYLIAAIGVLPILTGLFNICLVGPLFGCPLRGGETNS